MSQRPNHFNVEKTERTSLLRKFRGYDRLSFLIVLLAMLSLFLLLFGVQVTREASLESADVNHAGSLRFQSLLLYGVTHQESRNESWHPLLAKMTTCRDFLRNRYPQEVGQTASAWNSSLSR